MGAGRSRPSAALAAAPSATLSAQLLRSLAAGLGLGLCGAALSALTVLALRLGGAKGSIRGDGAGQQHSAKAAGPSKDEDEKDLAELLPELLEAARSRQVLEELVSKLEETWMRLEDESWRLARCDAMETLVERLLELSAGRTRAWVAVLSVHKELILARLEDLHDQKWDRAALDPDLYGEDGGGKKSGGCCGGGGGGGGGGG